MYWTNIINLGSILDMNVVNVLILLALKFSTWVLSSGSQLQGSSVGKTTSLAQNVVQKVAFGLTFPISAPSSQISAPNFGRQKVGFALRQQIVFWKQKS